MPDKQQRSRIFDELGRRNVFRVATAYIVGAWLLVQVVETIFPAFGYGDAAIRLVVIVLAVALIPTLVFSWAFEFTPEGLKREADVAREESTTRFTGKKIDRFIMVLLALALGYFAFDKFVLDPARDARLANEAAMQARAEALVEPYGDTSIAVLPFANLSTDAEQEYFSDGLSEELLNLLSRIPGLRVISKSSSFAFKGTQIPIPDLAGRLNVDHVLEGSVRKASGRLRVTAQLIEARSDTHLWSETYDREIDDIFAVQDEIAAAISDALSAHLVRGRGATVHPKAIKGSSTAAYEAYLQGLAAMHRRTDEDMKQAYDHLPRALRLDEGFAPAHAQLAIAMIMGGGGSRESAVAHLDRAQELEPDLAEAHAGRALLELQTTRDPEVVIEHALRALAVNPSLADAMNWLHLAQEEIGLYREADLTLEHLLLIDPATIIGRYNRAIGLAARGKIKSAHDMAEQIRMQSPAWADRAHAEISLEYEGRIADGLRSALRSHARNAYIVFGFILVGEFAEARRIDEEFTDWVDEAEGKWEVVIDGLSEAVRLHRDVEATNARLAAVLYRAGRIDEALPYFERAYGFVREGRPFFGPLPLHKTVWLAAARRQAGDEEGAQDAAQVARHDLQARRQAGRNHQELDQADALLAAFESDADRLFQALESAIDHGMRDRDVFNDPVFSEYLDDPRMLALRRELDSIVDSEHREVLRIICFDNPVPDEWQPLPETCGAL